MSNAPRDEHDETPDEAAPDSDAEDRAAILKRRAVFIASAIAGLTLASCDGEPQPCLDAPTTTGLGGTGGEPQPCLDMVPPTGGTGGTGGTPQPCLSQPATGGTGGTGGMGGTGGTGGTPRPCLDMVPPTGGTGGTGGM